MDSVQLLLINGQVFCLLTLAIPSFAGALYLILHRQRRWIRVRSLSAIGLMVVVFFSYRAIGQLVMAGQDVNPRCNPISHTEAQCKDIGLVTIEQANILLREDVAQDSLKCVIIPSLIGVTGLVIGLRRWLRRDIAAEHQIT